MKLSPLEVIDFSLALGTTLYLICQDYFICLEKIYGVYTIFLAYFSMIIAYMSYIVIWFRLEIYDILMLWCALCLNLILILFIQRVRVIGGDCPVHSAYSTCLV